MNNDSFVGVIVDAGHGGSDPGAVSGNLKEKDLTLQAATYMYERLNDLGIPAKLTRSGDTSLPKNERIEKVLELYNNQPGTILISNHINAGNGEGAEIVYALRNDSTLADMALNNIGEAGQKVRSAYQRRLPENPSKDYYYIIRETGNTEPLLVEYGFIDNANDARKLTTNLNNYVEGVVKAIADYIGIPYFEPGQNPSRDTYTVRPGDTLYKIAQKNNLTVEELKKINNLTSDTLKVGQVLNLTPQSLNTSTYIVQNGDTLYSIATKYNTTVDELKRLNNITNNSIYIGQQLLVPTIEEEPAIPIPPIPDTNYTTYIVVKGDSLWGIAKKYGITVDDLIALNDLEKLTLQVGDILKVPIIEDETYTVQKGDTLWSISKQLGIPINTIRSLNNLTNNLLSVGQVLIISDKKNTFNNN